MHKSGPSFCFANWQVCCFFNWGTPASPLSGVFWRKGGRRSLALNQSMWHMVLTRYCPWEMWAHWKSPTSQEASIRFTKLKCGPLASFQGYWSQALKLRNIWGLLRALTEQSLPSIDVSVLCGTLPLLSHNCFSPSFILLAKLLCILLVPAHWFLLPLTWIQTQMPNISWISHSPQSLSQCLAFLTVQIFFRSRTQVEKREVLSISYVDNMTNELIFDSLGH